MSHPDAIKRTKTHNCVGTEKFQGDAAGGSKLIEQTLRIEANELDTKQIANNTPRIPVFIQHKRRKIIG